MTPNDQSLPVRPALRDADDAELVAMVQSCPHGSPDRDAACEALIVRYRYLVRACARRYRESPESPEELMQVGYVGLMKAINNFDPTFGSSLAAYAQPCIAGEIKRHFRDKRWQVHVKRSVQELRLEVRHAVSELTQTLSRQPKDSELAAHLDVTAAELAEAQHADLIFEASSLDAPLYEGADRSTLADLLGDDDPQLEHVVNMEAVWARWKELPEREQRMLMMRFFGNMTQAEIGRKLQISQMHVSRLLGHAVSHLREGLVAPEPGGGKSCNARLS